MPTINEVCQYMQKSVEWNKFFSLVDTLGKSMNGQKDRFDKSDLLELALAEFSNGTIGYANQNGVDHLLLELPNSQGKPTTQEMKFVSELLYKEYVVERANKKTGFKGKREALPTRSDSVNIKIMNSMGENTHTCLPTSYAEFLLTVDNHSVHLVEVSRLIPFLDFNGDGILAEQVPVSLFTKVVGPEDLTDRRPLDNYNYKEEKLKLQYEFLRKFHGRV